MNNVSAETTVLLLMYSVGHAFPLAHEFVNFLDEFNVLDNCVRSCYLYWIT